MWVWLHSGTMTLYALYLFLSTVMLINLLIAMMSSTYDTIQVGERGRTVEGLGLGLGLGLTLTLTSPNPNSGERGRRVEGLGLVRAKVMVRPNPNLKP